MKPSEVLLAAKDVLLRRGWVQGPPTKDGVCAGRAVDIILIRADADDARPFNYLKHVVGFSIPGWNDAPGRTFQEVLDALDEAARLAKEAGE